MQFIMCLVYHIWPDAFSVHFMQWQWRSHFYFVHISMLRGCIVAAYRIHINGKHIQRAAIMHVFSWSNELRLWAFSFQCGTSDIHFRHKTDIIICPCLNRTHIHARTRYKNVCCVVENAMHGNRVLKAKLVENYFRLASVQKLRKCSVVCRRTQPAELQSVVVYVLRFVYTFIARCIQ